MIHRPEERTSSTRTRSSTSSRDFGTPRRPWLRRRADRNLPSITGPKVWSLSRRLSGGGARRLCMEAVCGQPRRQPPPCSGLWSNRYRTGAIAPCRRTSTAGPCAPRPQGAASTTSSEATSKVMAPVRGSRPPGKHRAMSCYAERLAVAAKSVSSTNTFMRTWAYQGRPWSTIVFSSVISATAQRGPSLPMPLPFRPP
jgi:hypothetical protein